GGGLGGGFGWLPRGGGEFPLVSAMAVAISLGAGIRGRGLSRGACERHAAAPVHYAAPCRRNPARQIPGADLSLAVAVPGALALLGCAHGARGIRPPLRGSPRRRSFVADAGGRRRQPARPGLVQEEF